MRDYAVFWGCTIPARFPSIEKATRLVLDDLGVHAHELDGYTCCPEGTLVKAAGTRHLLPGRRAQPGPRRQFRATTCSRPATAATPPSRRPSATSRPTLAERDARSTSACWPARVSTGRTSMQVLHLAEWLVDLEGAAAVARRAVRKLGGMRLAVHYGCHLLRPQPAVSWDDPLQPTKVEDAGQGARRPRRRLPDQDAVLRRRARPRGPARLLALHGATQAARPAGARGGRAGRGLPQLLPAVRPQPGGPAARRRGGRRAGALPLRAHRPVLRPRARGDRAGHAPRVASTAFLERWDERDAGRERARQSFDLRLLEECDSCAPAGTTARWRRSTLTFRPNDIVRRILDGDIDGVIADGQAWKCLECFTCLELCPSRIGLAETLRVLKEQRRPTAAGPSRCGRPTTSSGRRRARQAARVRARASSACRRCRQRRRRGARAHARRRRRPTMRPQRSE